jgi:hypothetical protein
MDKQTLALEKIHEFILVSLNLTKRGSDRDNTILLNFVYDNFEEYYEEEKEWHIVAFSTLKRKFGSVLKNYMNKQLVNFRTRFDWDEHQLNDWLYQTIQMNIDTYMQIVKKKYPKLYDDIEKRNIEGLAF